MKIEYFDIHFDDGGTIEIKTDEGTYCFDDRLESKTQGRLYEGYPKDDNSNLIINYKHIEKEITEELKKYKDPFYQAVVDDLIYLLETRPIISNFGNKL